MSRTPICPPMPVVLSTPEEAEDLYGLGSPLHIAAVDALEKERTARMHACRECGARVSLGANRWCAACRARDALFSALWQAFQRVGECIELVDAHARALHKESVSDDLTLRGCQSLAFRSLAVIHETSPRLLPFHDDCGDR